MRFGIGGCEENKRSTIPGLVGSEMYMCDMLEEALRSGRPY